jgi:hypothetical protein
MCTTPQNIFIPTSGIQVAGEKVTLDAVTAAIAGAVTALTATDEKAVEVLGAIASEATLARLDSATSAGEVVLASRKVDDPRFPGARVRTRAVRPDRLHRSDLEYERQHRAGDALGEGARCDHRRHLLDRREGARGGARCGGGRGRRAFV